MFSFTIIQLQLFFEPFFSYVVLFPECRFFFRLFFREETFLSFDTMNDEAGNYS